MKHHETLPVIPISRGEGVWLYDMEGKRYLDAISSWWVNLFGHANPRINSSIRDQIERLEHVMLAGFTHEPVVQLSERLAALAPSGLGHCFYSSDGSSAIEIALKMSYHYWRNAGKPGKVNFASLQNGYHGETMGALAVTHLDIFRHTYAPLLKHSAQLPSPDIRFAVDTKDEEAHVASCLHALETYLAQHADTISAFVLEPLVQCAGGMGIYSSMYLTRVRDVCSRYHVHLIADEIAVGFGRTGTMFACEQARISPDFLCLSKGLSGGYLPLSVTLVQEHIYQAFYDDNTAKAFLHSHSYSGNPIACRAALATLDIFEEDNILESNRGKAVYFTASAIKLKQHPLVRNFRSIGMIWAFEVENQCSNFAQHIFTEGLKRELLLRPLANTIYFMPPYVISTQEIDLLVERTLDVLQAL
jgi:adenosylmethionine---8-amino-7-oxononanoate aminotransferase